jgi:hypothetical protein
LRGGFGLLAGLGVLWRKQWGRILTFILAILAVIVGLLLLNANMQDAGGDGALISFGAAEILFGILASVSLIKHGAEFFRQTPGYAS